MKELTDELKVINASIEFATERDLDYLVYRYPANEALKLLEIHLGKGILLQETHFTFGVSCGLTKQGELKSPQLHVFPLDIQQAEGLEEFRNYLKEKFSKLEVNY